MANIIDWGLSQFPFKTDLSSATEDGNVLMFRSEFRSNYCFHTKSRQMEKRQEEYNNAMQ